MAEKTNIWDGVVYTGKYSSGTTLYADNDLTIFYVIPLIEGHDYKIVFNESHNRRRIVTTLFDPAQSTGTGIRALVETNSPTIPYGLDFTAATNENYLFVYVSNIGETPAISAHDMSVPDYDRKYLIRSNSTLYTTAGESETIEDVAVSNGDFETGDLTGWNCTAASGFGVNTDDAYEGSKFYFWSTTGKLYQSLTGLENGLYTVSAMFKQQTGTPTKADFYVNGSAASVKGLTAYAEKSITVKVEDGNLEFGIDFSGSGANVQADNFKVVRTIKQSGTLTALTETEVTASLFQTYGVDELPDAALLLGLTDPELLYWQDSTDALPTITAAVIGAPPVPQVVVTESFDMSDSTILGIESVTVEASDDVLWAVSFDDGATWKAYDGTGWAVLDQENSGMTAETFQNISVESWAAVVSGDHYRIRFVLMDTASYVASLTIHYLNEEV